MNTSVSILFYIKRAKANNLGVCPIYTRVTVKTKRFEFSTTKYINPDKWSSEGSKAKGTNEEARTINSHLDYLKNQALDAEKKLFKKDNSVTSENLKNELFGLSETKRMLVPIFLDHNNKIREPVGKEYAPGTLERYTTSLKHTIEFMQWKYRYQWYTDQEGNMSSCADPINKDDEKNKVWLNKYWSNFQNGATTKLKDWEYENEYRLLINDMLNDYETTEKRKLKYDFNDLEGIIFGIKTSVDSPKNSTV